MKIWQPYNRSLFFQHVFIPFSKSASLSIQWIAMKKTFDIERGFPHPFGVTKLSNGTNFSIFSRHASAVSLCIFDEKTHAQSSEIPLDPKKNRTGQIWHVLVKNLEENYLYGYRVDGPYDPFKGHYFDNRIILHDPLAKKVVYEPKSNNYLGHIQSIKAFDWGEDTHPNIPLKELVIYEMHVRGFTQDRSSSVKNPGSFLGMIEKIPYLKSLGVNSVELLPVFTFNEKETIFQNPYTQERLCNFWGYSTVNFFSLMEGFATDKKNVINEFKSLVKELHANRIEVILDVVYNHTAEGGKEGPIFSFKGLENSIYYMLAPNGEYFNFSGCGNTMNCNHPLVREFIRESLRYWVTEMHVDGFRFDLASILVRSHDGIPLTSPPLIEAITLDPILANTKLIAEPWDAGGLYQVGTFPGMGVWAEWNGKYRDTVRRFIKGTDREIGNFATRLAGSEDLFGKGRLPSHSINFITAHDGFTLADLVSYNEKHNEANGESNRDGSNVNDSWNCGEEGRTEDPIILALREKQMKNLHLALMVSQGVPMLLMGDEYGHSKEGNNNSYCHDSRMNWFQWDTLERKQNFFRFYKMMITFRKRHPALMHSHFLSSKEIQWHGKEPFKPDWSEKSRFLAFSLEDALNGYTLYVAFNASFEEAVIRLPELEAEWRQIAYTALESPEDIVEESEAKELVEKLLVLAPHSALILKSLT